jgi:endonuclease YncB( thermonuclease family)
MRIAQTQFMRDCKLLHATAGLVASALAAGLLCAGTGSPESRPHASQAAIGGHAKVVDGDTIVVNATRIRLEGIDAPEAGQTCGRQPSCRRHGSDMCDWPCGTEATAALAGLIEGKVVRCQARGADRYGRTLAVCFLGEEDVNAWMVRWGHARAFVRYSTRYVAEEQQARAQRLGIWQGEAIPAWEHRARRWAAAVPQALQGCTIKGNVTARGKIYHMPGSPWYERIDMDAGKGRRWFCTEAEALAAGWRPVNLRQAEGHRSQH